MWNQSLLAGAATRAARWMLITAFSFFLATPAASEPDFKGRQLVIVIGYGVGGTYYQYAQLFSRHLGRLLPGEPVVIVQSMPGAGGVRMLNEAAVRMRADGTHLFMPPDTMVVAQLLEPTGVQFDARRFQYLGTADQQNTLWAVRRAAATSLADMKAREVFMASSGRGSTGQLIPAMGAAMLGLKVKLVGGYDGSREQFLAMEKGEVDGTVQAIQAWQQARPTWLEPGSGFAVPLLQVGVEADPSMPGVPLLSSLVAPADRPLVALFDTIGVLGRGLAVPPATPVDITAALRRAFERMLADKDYRADATSQKLRILPRSGSDVAKAVSETIAGADAALLERARALAR